MVLPVAVLARNLGSLEAALAVLRRTWPVRDGQASNSSPMADSGFQRIFAGGRIRHAADVQVVLEKAHLRSARVLTNLKHQKQQLQQFLRVIQEAAGEVPPERWSRAEIGLTDLFGVLGDGQEDLHEAAVTDCKKAISDRPMEKFVQPEVPGMVRPAGDLVDKMWVRPEAPAMPQPSKRKAECFQSSGEDPSLQFIEMVKKDKWAKRLEDLLSGGWEASAWKDRAQGWSEGQATALRSAALRRGAWRTICKHVQCWERIRHWVVQAIEEAQSTDGFGTEKFPGARLLQPHEFVEVLYPPQEKVILAYVVHRAGHECGPTVPDSVRDSVKWICTRLKMLEPELGSQELLAIRDEVNELRRQELREAEEIPVRIVQCMEEAMLEDLPPVLRILMWFFLLAIWGTLRFDDLLHVRPSSFRLRSDALLGSSWQTKVARKRRSVAFSCLRAGGNIGISKK